MLAAVLLCGCKKNVDPVVDAPPDEYINYSVNGIPYSFETPVDSILSIPGGLTFVLRVNGNRKPANSNFVTVVFDYISISVGTYQHLLAFNVDQVPTNSSINAPIFVRITECGPTGQFVAGDFLGSYTGPPPGNIVYNITCNFRIRRTF